jgi:hypothetical protein
MKWLSHQNQISAKDKSCANLCFTDGTAVILIRNASVNINAYRTLFNITFVGVEPETYVLKKLVDYKRRFQTNL